MRRSIFLTIAMLAGILSLSSARAQSVMDFGVRVGVNIANAHIDPLDAGTTTSSKLGFIGGGQLDYWFGPTFGIGAGVLFDQKGVVVTSSQSVLGVTITGTSTITANYVEIPVVIKARFGTGNIRPYLFLGPTFGVLLSASDHQNVNGMDSTSDVKNQFTSSDIGILAGGGVTVAIDANTMVFLEAGYAYGVVNIASNPPNSGPNTTVNSRDIRLTAGILFGQ